MSSFTFINNDVLIDGVSTSAVATTLQAAGIGESKIGEILGHWYAGTTGRARPMDFDFSTEVQSHDPSCEISYARQFIHEDWFDGEDRVQATATPEELGFNARFHSIENEFDAIAAQFAGLGKCAEELRSDLVGIVRELESKLTAMSQQIFELRKETEPVKVNEGLGVLGTVKVGDQEAVIAKFGNDFRLLEFDAEIVGRGVHPHVAEHPRVFVPGTVKPRDVVEIVAGLEDVFSTPGLRELMERGTTVAELRTVADGATLPGGTTLASVIAAMPAETKLPGVAGALDVVTRHVADSLPAATARKTTTEVLTDVSLRSGTSKAVAAASAGGVGLSSTTLAALGAAKIDATIGSLAGTTTSQLAGKVSELGLDVSTDVLRGAVARAHLATALRRK